MRTREEALVYGLSFPGTYQEAPFHDPNWQLVRVQGSKKAFLWTYEMDGLIHLNVKVDPQWRDFWRDAYEAVLPGYHQNKEHWNTIRLDGTIPDVDVKRMIAESYDLVTDSPTKRIYEAVKRIPKGHVATYAQVAKMAGNEKMWSEMPCTRTRIRTIFPVFVLSMPKDNSPVHLLLMDQRSRQGDFGRMVLW